jgi:hydrogenase assembly chaperone HypC/HupF
MCITTIGKVLELDKNTALVQLRKSTRKVRTDLVDVKKGDYIYVSGNLAIEKIEKEEAEQILNSREKVKIENGNLE